MNNGTRILKSSKPYLGGRAMAKSRKLLCSSSFNYAFRLLIITIFLFGLLPIPVLAVEPKPEPASFAISDLSVTPSEIGPAEEVTVSAVVNNTSSSEGEYTVVLKINGIEEARKEVTLGAGASQKVSFSIVKNIAETYEVDINGLVGSFVVKEAAVTPLPAPSAAPLPTQPAVSPLPAQPAKLIDWWFIGSIIMAIIFIGVLTWLLVMRRRAL